MTHAAAKAMPDPFTHCEGTGIEPVLLQQPESLQSDSEPTVGIQRRKCFEIGRFGFSGTSAPENSSF